MSRLPGCLAVALTALLIVADQSLAVEPSGNVIAVVQSSSADGITGRRTLSVQAPVFSGDRIVTGPVGETQVRFRDDTKLVVGPNSSMTIDAFVFNADDTARQVSINAVRGAFRFITGAGPKDAYEITTPTATIGVRGTEFDLTIDEIGVTSVAVFSGVTRLCDRRRQTCVEQRAGCSVGVVEPNAQPRNVEDQAERQRRLQRSFRYVRSQQSLLSDFRVSVASCAQRVENIDRNAPQIVPVQGGPPPPPPPPPPPTEGNRSGLADGSNPGLNKGASVGSQNNNAKNAGSDNPSIKGG